MTAMRSAALIALLALTGCGEEGDRNSVTLVHREVSYDRSYFTSYPLVAEVHNAPFDGIAPQDVASMLRLPPSYPAGGAFAFVEAGAQPREKVRLALAFNSRAPLASRDLCAATLPLGAATPLNDQQYMVDLALCRDDTAIASASMTAEAGGPRDAAFAERSLNHLMLVVFGSHAERADWER